MKAVGHVCTSSRWTHKSAMTALCTYSAVIQPMLLGLLWASRNPTRPGSCQPCSRGGERVQDSSVARVPLLCWCVSVAKVGSAVWVGAAKSAHSKSILGSQPASHSLASASLRATHQIGLGRGGRDTGSAIIGQLGPVRIQLGCMLLRAVHRLSYWCRPPLARVMHVLGMLMLLVMWCLLPCSAAALLLLLPCTPSPQ
jgi:hypothetical protein